MIDNLLGDEDDGETADESDDGEMDGLFGEPDDAGGDDLMGGDDMAFDDVDGSGGATNSEVVNRIDELENEVASLSSTVNTVKSENEQISESLDDVEENIRKLLEVYEMVTRGVNPFVNENELGDAFGAAGDTGGSMSLFGDEEVNDQEDAGIDESVANADADDFFDDDFDDFDDGDDEDAENTFDDGDDGGGFDDGFDDADEEAGDAGGKSFEELKSEYESGEADWDDGDGDDAGEPPGDEGAVEPELELGEGDAEADDGGDGADGPPETTEPPAVGRREETPPDAEAVEGDKPYLGELPSGYVADVVVMDWLEFLVDEGGVDGAARTIAYYESIDWISETATERLLTFLRGFGEGVDDDPEARSTLTVGHHNASLRFISRIVDPSMEAVAFDGRIELRHGALPGANGERGPGDPIAVGSGRRPRASSPTAPDEPEVESDGGHRSATADAATDDRPAERSDEWPGNSLSEADDREETDCCCGFHWEEDRS